MAVEEGDDAQHILIILIVADRLGIGLKEGDVLGAGELAGELVDVDGLVVKASVLKAEGLLGDEVDDVVVGVDTHHRAVHPALILGHERQVGMRVVHQEPQHTVVEDQVALYQ